MNKKTSSRPVFPFTSIVGQEEICDFNSKHLKKTVSNLKFSKYKARAN